MTLARKELLDYIPVKSEGMMEQATAERKTADLKALAIIARMLSPRFQSMIRNASNTAHAWNILRDFHVKRSLHHRVQLCKQPHDFVMTPGDYIIMKHFLKFDNFFLHSSCLGR